MSYSKEPSYPKDDSKASSLLLGDVLFPLRLVIGWTYFSAFWRRLILENKLIPDDPGYIGEKFNHFLPNAFLIKPALEFFLTHPELLWWKLLLFTLLEAVVGLALFMGFMTRIAGILISMMAMGILLGAGWLGTTCLDEWQIGILGVSTGIAFALAGGGKYSIDHFLTSRCPKVIRRPFGLLFSCGDLIKPHNLSRVALIGGMGVFALTLLTNQIFHGGVCGPLHNKSLVPKLLITEPRVSSEGLRFTVNRVEGADTYGSFLIGVKLLDASGKEVSSWSAEDLSKIPLQDIFNRYIAKIKPEVHSLIIPLGAKAEILLRNGMVQRLPSGDYTLELVDISGVQWTVNFQLCSHDGSDT